MCIDPVTLLAIAGSAVSAGGALVQGQQAAALAEQQARAFEQQARAEAQASGHEQQQERRRQDMAAAVARAQAGASGVALGGSPTEVLAANARHGELDIQAIRYGSQLRQNQLGTQASISRFQGRQAKLASYFSAGSELVSGVTPLFERRSTDPGRPARTNPIR